MEADAVIAMSLLRYLAVGSYAKRADVMGGQTPEACLEYFKMFSRNGAYKRKSSMTPLPNISGKCGNETVTLKTWRPYVHHRTK